MAEAARLNGVKMGEREGKLLLCRFVVIPLLITTCSSVSAESAFPDLTLDDAEQMVIKKPGANGETYWLNLELWDRKGEAAWRRAASYPPTFSSDEEREKTVELVTFLISVIEGLRRHFESNSEMAYRAANTYRMAFNLDIPDVLQQREDAKRYYELALQFKPNDARTHWLYGSYLCSAQECQEGAHYLERARDLGSINALFDLALVSLNSCDETRAGEYLKRYLKDYPTDERALLLLKALRSGSFVNKLCESAQP